MNAVARLPTNPTLASRPITAEDLRRIIRDERIFAPTWAGTTPIAHAPSERTILVAMFDRWAKEDDLAGLAGSDFFDAGHGYVFIAMQSGAFGTKEIARHLAARREGSPDRILTFVERLFAERNVLEWGSLQSHVARVIALSRRRAIHRVAYELAVSAYGGEVATIDAAKRFLEDRLPSDSQ